MIPKEKKEHVKLDPLQVNILKISKEVHFMILTRTTCFSTLTNEDNHEKYLIIFSRLLLPSCRSSSGAGSLMK
jgi:hypothetical protein